MTQPETKLDLSLVIPMYEEEENAPILHERITAALDALPNITSEIIYINDGSGDRTLEQLKKLCDADDRVIVIDLRRNFGQTAAMSAGFDASRGEVIVAMDGDLQNDPSDIERLLDKLNEGYDVVSGWRVDRQDNWLRRIPSRIANWLIGRVTGVRLHDYGCSLKAYRAEVLKDVRLYGEMHRFIPALASWVGARVTEMPVKHHARQFGQAKYGISRTVRVILDLITVKFILSFSTRPLQIFGLAGIGCSGLGGLILFIEVGKKILRDHYGLADKPIVLAGVLLLILGVQMISIGLLAELQVRTYHESQNKPIYTIREIFGQRS